MSVDRKEGYPQKSPLCDGHSHRPRRQTISEDRDDYITLRRLDHPTLKRVPQRHSELRTPNSELLAAYPPAAIQCEIQTPAINKEILVVEFGMSETTILRKPKRG